MSMIASRSRRFSRTLDYSFAQHRNGLNQVRGRVHPVAPRNENRSASAPSRQV